MQVKFLQAAQHELDDAIDYYNAQASNLGQRFLVEVLACLNRVCQYPDAWHSIIDKIKTLPIKALSLWFDLYKK